MPAFSAELQLEAIYVAAQHVDPCWQKVGSALQVTHVCKADCSPVQDGCFSFVVACIHNIWIDPNSAHSSLHNIVDSCLPGRSAQASKHAHLQAVACETAAHHRTETSCTPSCSLPFGSSGSLAISSAAVACRRRLSHALMKAASTQSCVLVSSTNHL